MCYKALRDRFGFENRELGNRGPANWRTERGWLVAMKVIEVWRERRPRSVAARLILYAATLTVVILLGVLAVRVFTVKPAEDCNKPAAPVVVPKAPAGLIVDAPCTDGSAPKATSPGK